MQKSNKAANHSQNGAPQPSAEDLNGAVHEAAAADQANAQVDAASPAGDAPQAAPAAELAGQAEATSLREQLLRTAADFENFRKRTRLEQDELRRYGTQRLLEDLLPVVDNLERALAHAPADSQDPVIAGIRMVVKQWHDTLGNYGVKTFASQNTRFDPERHEAVGQETSTTNAPGTVLTELQSGYMLHERLLRPARVVVADQASGSAIS
jgi:molecular chaperone GrpE